MSAGAPLGWALAAGAFFALAAPPTDVYPALWLGMAGLAFLVGQVPFERGKHALSLGVAFGTGANFVAFRFVPTVIGRFTTIPATAAWLALVLLAMEQGLRWGAAAWVMHALRHRGVPSAWAFATGVFAGTFVPAVFPWNAAGGVTPIPEMVQLAEFVGERGVTFLMALSAGLAASAMAAGLAWKARARPLAIALALPLLTYVEGHWRIGAVEALRAQAKTIRVALVQPGVDATDRWDVAHSLSILTKLTTATKAAEQQGVELTVWPEAAYPFPVSHAARRCPAGSLAVIPGGGARGPVLTGMVMTGANGDVWNSAAICTPDGGMTAPQDKQHLLWFGETIPWIDKLEWVRAHVTKGIGLVAGKGVVSQAIRHARIATLICFEDTLPDAGREAMEPRPNLLVNVTNDSWFQGSGESELHLRLAALRAVESRRDLVRAVNEGATSWVDAAGVVRARVSGAAPDSLIADAALLETPPTLFDRLGDLPLLFVLLAVGLSMMARTWRAPA